MQQICKPITDKNCARQGFHFAVAIVLLSVAGACNKTASGTAESASKCLADGREISRVATEGCPSQKAEKKIAVLVVSHGSRSRSWREMVLDIEKAVRKDIVANGRVSAISFAFMEYGEPSIATQLKELDAQGCSDVILIPLLLTVSSHSFDDIPTICGQKQDRKTVETLRLEGVEIYKPKARIHIAPLLDFPSVLGKNVTRRAREMSTDTSNEAIVMVAYGSEPYKQEWEELLERVGDEVKAKTGIDCVEYAWCGHLVHYQSEPTEKAIRNTMQQKQKVLVVPVLVAVDEMFQGKIIGGAVKSVGEKDRIAYRHDAILPDENINRWVIDISREMAAKLTDKPDTANQPQ